MDAKSEKLLITAAQEITSLRRANELMNAKLSVLDFIETMLHTRPASGGVGHSVDIVWEIERELLEKKREGEVKTASSDVSSPNQSSIHNQQI